MNTEMILAVLGVWSVAGFMAALAFGKAIRAIESTDELLLRTAGSNVTYFRKNRRKTKPQWSNIVHTHDGARKRAIR